jgi:ankyrin repeat protein
MKKLFFIAGFMAVGLFLEVGVSFAADRWEPTGPTAEDIRAATKVENLAAKGSREDKLISAIIDGDSKAVKAHIAAGANVNARDGDNKTALMRAAEKGYTDIVRVLIDAGADVNAKDEFDCTAFFKAADKNHIDIVKILIAEGAATDSDILEGFFMSSVLNGNTEMVKALMVESAKIKYDILDEAYMIALNRRRCNPEIFNVIKDHLENLNSSKIVD